MGFCPKFGGRPKFSQIAPSCKPPLVETFFCEESPPLFGNPFNFFLFTNSLFFRTRVSHPTQVHTFTPRISRALSPPRKIPQSWGTKPTKFGKNLVKMLQETPNCLNLLFLFSPTCWPLKNLFRAILKKIQSFCPLIPYYRE